MRSVIYPRLPFNKRSPSLRVTHPRRLASFHTHCFVSRLSLLRPKLNLLNSQETRTVFPLCDLQGGRCLLLRHLLRWNKMFSPSNEFAPRWCLENAQSPSNGKRNLEGNELALALTVSAHRPGLLDPFNFAQMFHNLSTALISPITSQNVPVESLLF